MFDIWGVFVGGLEESSISLVPSRPRACTISGDITQRGKADLQG
jgi:hypothetical protein